MITPTNGNRVAPASSGPTRSFTHRGEPPYQVRLGYTGIHLELGDSFEFEVTIDTPLAVTTTGARWAGEPLTAEAAGALLRLLGAGVTSASVAPDGALHLVIGEAAIEVWPNDYYESWQLRGPRNLRVVCSPDGEYIAVFEPDGEA